MNLLAKNIKRNAYIVVICYIILVCFYNVFNHITKLGMPELHSFSLEGIQNLIGTFAIPMMLLFESYRHGDWVLNTINKLLTIAPFLFYILLPIVLKKKTSFQFQKLFSHHRCYYIFDIRTYNAAYSGCGFIGCYSNSCLYFYAVLSKSTV